MSIHEKLASIQQALKVPKGQYNDFGKYKYRSCEDILEALKPELSKRKCTVVLTDTIQQIGERFYVMATASITDTETGEMVCNNAFAREDAEKKGMDGSQITGTASSYARKYALNGMFLIDDTKDADTDEYHQQNDNTVRCAQCGGNIASVKTKSGNQWTAEQLIATSTEQAGKPMCAKCYAKFLKENTPE